MSRLTQSIHDHFGTSENQSAADIVLGFLGSKLGSVREIIADIVAMLEGSGLTGAEKKQLATTMVNFFLARLGIHIRAALVSFLIEEAVLLLKGGKPSTQPVPEPAPPVDPTSVEYDTKEAAIAATTPAYPLVIQKNGKFYVWPNVGPLPGPQVYP